MRIRNVKPEFYRSDDIDALTWEQRFFFIALFTYVDDNGVGRDREVDICADLFAGDFAADPTETLRRVRQCLGTLCRAGLLVRYEVEGRRFLFVTGWDSHQYVKNPNKERYPRPDKGLLQASVHPGEKRSNESVDAIPDVPPVVGSKSLVVGSGKVLDRSDPDARPEVLDLCNLLAEYIEGNGSNRPSVTKQWLDACRLMLDKDGRSVEDIRGAIAWCQRDEFWRTNILSMPKLREKFDQLRLQAQRTKTNGKQQQTDDLFSRAAIRLGVLDHPEAS